MTKANSVHDKMRMRRAVGEIGENILLIKNSYTQAVCVSEWSSNLYKAKFCCKGSQVQVKTLR